MASIIYTLTAVAGLFSTAFALPLEQRSIGLKSTLPLSECGAGLPPPSSSPLFIVVGTGTQNYTCNATTGTYSSNTALANLYDATTIVTSLSKDSISRTYLTSAQCGIENPLLLNLVGHHFFDPKSQPNFQFTTNATPRLQAKKSANALAPATASKGATNAAYGAVDWLYLIDNGAGVSHGLKSVYRVETAGGKPPTTCTGSAQVEVPYAAEYWFYD